MINIFVSSLGLLTSQGKCVQTISEYPAAYLNIINAVESRTNLTLNVKTGVVLHWFKNMSTPYPQGTFVFKTLGARAAMAQRWKIKANIPPAIVIDSRFEDKLFTIARAFRL